MWHHSNGYLNELMNTVLQHDRQERSNKERNVAYLVAVKTEKETEITSDLEFHQDQKVHTNATFTKKQ